MCTLTILKGLFSYQVHQIESPSPYAARITTPFVPRCPLLWDQANSEHSGPVRAHLYTRINPAVSSSGPQLATSQTVHFSHNPAEKET